MPCEDDRMLPECANEFAHIRETLDEIKIAVIGNGTEGLRIKVDRLEQKESARLWLNRAILAAVIGLLLKGGYDMFIKVVDHVQ